MATYQEAITAAQALELKLVNRVVPHEELMKTVGEIAARIAKGPQVSYRYMKENLNRAVHGELGECLDMEAAHHIRTGRTEDHREAAAAFVEKREPRFSGR